MTQPHIPTSPVANESSPGTQNFWGRGWLAALVLIVVTFLAYQPVWQAGFVWDDDIMLTQNEFIHAADGLRDIWFSTKLPDYFPLTSTTLWLEWRLWGKNPLGYHLVNVLLHALSAVVLWRVLLRLKIPGAWLVATLFALHPVNVESVAWITERKNTLAMFFFAAALLAYLRFEAGAQRGWYITALGMFVLGLLSKTAVAPLPVVLLGMGWWQRGKIQLRDVWRVLPFFAAAGVLAVVTIWFQYERSIGETIVRTDGFWSRLAGAGWAVWFYFYKAVVPFNQIFTYPRWQIDAANVFSYVPGLLLVVVLFICWRSRRREEAEGSPPHESPPPHVGGYKSWTRATFFALAFFVVMLLPILGFLNISFMRYSLVADRWQYFAILGPIALVVAGLNAVLNRFVGPRQFERVLLGGTAVILLGLLTWKQSSTYTNLETLWQTTIARNPDSFVARTDLANILFNKNQVDEAIAHYRRALEIEPNYELAHYNLGYALLQKNQVVEALTHLERAAALQPDFMPAQYQLGNALLRHGDLNAAILPLRQAVKLEPKFAEAQNTLGDTLLQSGQANEAIIHFQNALRIQPEFPLALNNLGVARIQQGDAAASLTLFQKVVQAQPDFVEARNNLARVLILNGQPREAVTHYRAALKIQPDDAEILASLAWILATSTDATLRDGSQALQLARRANQLSGGQNPLTLRTLAAACAEAGQFAEAKTTAQHALKLAETQSDAALAAALRAELKCYDAGIPFRETAAAPAAVALKQP